MKLQNNITSLQAAKQTVDFEVQCFCPCSLRRLLVATMTSRIDYQWTVRPKMQMSTCIKGPVCNTRLDL